MTILSVWSPIHRRGIVTPMTPTEFRAYRAEVSRNLREKKARKRASYQKRKRNLKQSYGQFKKWYNDLSKGQSLLFHWYVNHGLVALIMIAQAIPYGPGLYASWYWSLGQFAAAAFLIVAAIHLVYVIAYKFRDFSGRQLRIMLDRIPKNLGLS